MLEQELGAGLTSNEVGTTKPTHCYVPRALPSHYGGGWGQFSHSGPWPLHPALQGAPRAPVGSQQSGGSPSGVTRSRLKPAHKLLRSLEGLLESPPAQELAPTAGPSQLCSGDPGTD